MSKRVQVVLPDRTAQQIEDTVKEEGYENVSDFLRTLTQDYLFRKQYGLLGTVKNNLDDAQTPLSTEELTELFARPFTEVPMFASPY